MADPFRFAFDVWAAARVPLSRYLPEIDIETTDELLADRNGAATPRIMVFGTYNAGKSTLINALMGNVVAPVADHPETDHVTSYPWRGFMLDDTPGIDAPIEHERVTRAHLEASDAVLFVLATDGTLEEQRSFKEIIAIVQAGKPIRIVLNNKSGFRPDAPEFLSLRDRLAENLRHAAAAAFIKDIENCVPIRLVNAASGLRARLEGKPQLLVHSGLLDLEADIAELCGATGKAQMARTVCQRMAKQIDLALGDLPVSHGMQPFREIVDAVAAERARLGAVLDHATQEAAAHFQAALGFAVSSHEPQRGEAAASEAAEAVTAIIERELRKTQRVFNDIETAFTSQTPAIRTISGQSVPIPGSPALQDTLQDGGFKFRDAANILSPALNQLDKQVVVDGLMAAKQVFPTLFKGLGPKFFGQVVPFIGPAIQTVTGVYDTYAAHRQAKKDFEREKSHRLAVAQQVENAGRKMRWALAQQCQDVIEQVFSPAEDALARQAASLKGMAAVVEADHTVLVKCRGRLDIVLEADVARPGAGLLREPTST